MRMPGFTAESSLYVSHERYHIQMSMPRHQQVIPQLRISCLIRAGQGFLSCVNRGVFDQSTCATFARAQYAVCDFAGGFD